MLAPFAALESRLNSAVFGRLSNAVATVAGVEVAGIFTQLPAMGNVGTLGMVTTGPELMLPTASVPAEPIGAAVTVAGVAYLVAGHEPDGTGVSRLALELAA